MATQHLNRELRAHLLFEVMKDQFLEEANELNKQFKEKLQEVMHDKYAEVHKAMHELAESHDLDPAIFCNRNYQVYVREAGTALYVSNFANKSWGSLKELASFDRRAEPSIYIPPTTAWGEREFLAENLEGIPEIIAAQKEFIKNAKEVHDALRTVLLSVKTVKKLQELTKVFDPFLPKDKTAAAMIPAEQLCKINELESPKSK